MSGIVKVEVDVSTGIETITELNAEEIAEMEASVAAANERKAAEEAAAEKAAADKASGNQKLKDLGLTDDEIAAITS